MQARYKDLDVWQHAMDLTVAAYQCTAKYPKHEQYGLVSQTRRAAVSVPSNIAEGQGRAQPGEFLNQLSVARGSLQEFETLCILAHRLKYASDEQLEALLAHADRISRMLTGLRKAVERANRSRGRQPARPARDAEERR